MSARDDHAKHETDAMYDEIDALRTALIEFYDFVQNELEADPYANEVGSYVHDLKAKEVANALLIARDAGLGTEGDTE